MVGDIVRVRGLAIRQLTAPVFVIHSVHAHPAEVTSSLGGAGMVYCHTDNIPGSSC